MRKMRWFENIKEAMPTWISGPAKRLLTSQEHFEVNWESARRDEIVAQLADDAKLFLSHCQKPLSFWDLAT